MEAFTKPVCTGSTELCPTRSSGASGEEGYPYCAVIKFKTQRGIFCYHPALSLPLLRIGSPTSRSTRNSRPMRRCRDLNWISPAIRGAALPITSSGFCPYHQCVPSGDGHSSEEGRTGCLSSRTLISAINSTEPGDQEADSSLNLHHLYKPRKLQDFSYTKSH
ncbi:uncharacterized protein LOC143435099 isoform X8 [Arvicanthis niloticus]|uniref:uncharacterized protein LOC143435099 isoform X8 n=1 Tax=Arvicanthis niloticus TaxID=61156 RepID=UPI00403C425A